MDLILPAVLPPCQIKSVDLKTYSGQPLAILFYPYDFLDTYHFELREFADKYQAFKDLGCQVPTIFSSSESGCCFFTEVNPHSSKNCKAFFFFHHLVRVMLHGFCIFAFCLDDFGQGSHGVQGSRREDSVPNAGWQNTDVLFQDECPRWNFGAGRTFICPSGFPRYLF